MGLKISYHSSTWTERLAIIGLLAFSLALAQMTAWKESELFWLEIGGYPRWLREVVKSLYYPFTFFVLASALMICRSVAGRFFRELQVRRIWGVLVVALAVIAGSIGLLVANNVINLIDGRPLHYHEPRD